MLWANEQGVGVEFLETESIGGASVLGIVDLLLQFLGHFTETAQLDRVQLKDTTLIILLNYLAIGALDAIIGNSFIRKPKIPDRAFFLFGVKFQGIPRWDIRPGMLPEWCSTTVYLEKEAHDVALVLSSGALLATVAQIGQSDAQIGAVFGGRRASSGLLTLTGWNRAVTTVR